MKKIILALVIISTLIIAKNIFAQESQILAVVHYQNREDLDVLFANSIKTLDYFEGEEIESPLFIGIFTQTQLDAIKNNKLDSTTIETNPNMARFALFYQPNANSEDKIKQYGEIFPVSNHLVFVKQPEGQDNTHLIESEGFFEIHLDEPYVTPPYRTKTITTTPILQMNQEQPKSTISFLPVLFFILLFILIAVSIVLLKRAKSTTNSSGGPTGGGPDGAQLAEHRRDEGGTGPAQN